MEATASTRRPSMWYLRSEEHTSELQSRGHLVCRLLLEKKKIDIFQGLGAAVNALPGAEIVPAMDRGLLDAAEYNNTTSDRALGSADVSKVCMPQSWQQ